MAERTLKVTAMDSADGTIWLAGEDGDKALAFYVDEPK